MIRNIIKTKNGPNLIAAIDFNRRMELWNLIRTFKNHLEQIRNLEHHL